MALGSSVNRLLLDVVGNSADAQRALAEVTTEIRQFGTTRAEAELSVTGLDAFAKLEELRAQLDGIDRTKASAAVSVQVGAALAEIEALQLRLSRLDTENVDIDVDVKRGVLQDLTAMERQVANLGRTFAQSVKPGESLGEAATGLLLKLRALTPIISGLVVLIGVSLISALGALVASFAAAAGGAVALVNSLVAAFGPGLLLVIGLVQRFAAVLQVLQARKAAQDAATRGGVSASRQAASADKSQADAAASLRDARQAVTRAHRDYKQAVDDARDALRQQIATEREAAKATREAAAEVTRAQADVHAAREQAKKDIDDARATQQQATTALGREQRQAAQEIADANQRISDANDEVAQRAAEAYQDYQDTLQEVTDRTLGLRDAQLDLQDAEDAVGDKQREINKLLREMGATDPTEALKKLSNVDLTNTLDLGGLGLQGDEAQAEKLKDLYRELERAKLNVEKASNAQTKAEASLNSAQDKANQYAQNGIDTYGPYHDAVRAAADAQENLGRVTEQANAQVDDARKRAEDATKALFALAMQGITGAPGVVSAVDSERQARERLHDAQAKEREEEDRLAELRKQGISRAPGVIAAADGLRDANERLADAQRHAREAGTSAADQLAAGAGAAALYKQRLADLSPAERDFAVALMGAAVVFRDVLQPATDDVFRGMTDGLKIVAPLFVSLRGVFKDLGSAWGDVIRAFATELIRPEWVVGLHTLIEGAARLSRIFGERVFLAFLRIVRDLGLAGLPALEKAADAVADALERWQGQTSDIGKMSHAIDFMVDTLGLWLSVIGKIAGAFEAFVEIAAPFGNEIVKWIGEGADKLQDWLRSKEGMDTVSAFFRDTLPFAKSLVTFIARLVVVFLQLFQFAAPALTGVFDGINLILGAFSKVMALLNKIPAPIRAALGIALAFMTGIGEGAGAAEIAIGGVRIAIGLVVAALGVLGSVGETVVSAVSGGFVKLWDFLKGFGSDLAGLGSWVLEKIVDGVTGAGHFVSDAAAWIFNTYKRYIEAQLGVWKAVGSWVVNRIADGLTTVTSELAGVGGWLKNRVVDAIEGAASGFIAAGAWVVNRLADGITTLTSALGAVGGWLKNRVEDAIHGALDGFVSIGTWVVNRLADGITTIVDALLHVGPWLVSALEDVIKGTAKGAVSLASRFGELGEWMLRAVINGFIHAATSAKDIANAVIDFLNWLIPNSIDVPHGPNINLPNNPIDHLAEGGIATRSTLAEIGEGAVNEAVIPLSQAVLRSLGEAIVMAMPDLSLAGAALTGPGAAGPGGIGHFEQHNHFPPAPGGDFPDISVIRAQLAQAARAQGGMP